MEIVTTAVTLAKLAPPAIKAAKKAKKSLKDRQIKKELKECLEDAEKAFWDRMPKGMAADPAILSKFLGGAVFGSQCQRILEGKPYNLTALENEFDNLGYTPIPGFTPRLAIAEYFDQFIQSASRKDSFANVVISLRESEGFKGRYFSQLAKAYENLSFGGVPDAHGHTEVKLEDIFIKLDASQRIPMVDILAEEMGQPDIMDRRRDIDFRRPAESVQPLHLMDALGDNKNLVVLGAPGPGKTTFVRYLALAFAQNLSNEWFDLDEDRLPILITLRDVAESLLKKPIADTLEKHVNRELQLDLPKNYFRTYLESGRCIVLFDGLDEVANVKQRGEVAQAVALFANSYKGNRYIITSRIAGYREIQQLPGSDFPHFTIRDFDDDQIKDFAKKWYGVRYPMEADKRADNLLQAMERNPKVKQLATNPLMLTIIAVVHRSSAELPNERIKLYDHCTEVLLHSWQREHDRPPLVDANGDPIPDADVRYHLEQLAYWIHSQSSTDAQGLIHVRYKDLESQLKDQWVELNGIEDHRARAEAKNFLEYVRKTTGVLLERGTELYAFVHLTFQEYFAAYDIYQRCGTDVDKLWEEMSHRLHDGHWREVIRLLVAKLSGEHRGMGEKLVQKILGAETPDEYLLRRDLLLAASCLADDVRVKVDTSRQILDDVMNIAISSPYKVQEEYATDILQDLANSHYASYVMEKFATLLEDRNVRGRVAYALESIGKADDQIIDKLIILLEDADSSVRRNAASALGSIGKADDQVIDKLLPLLEDADSSVRRSAASALGSIGKTDDRVIDELLILLEDSSVRWIAASALGSIGKGHDQVIDKLLPFLDDADSSVRMRAASALGSIGKADDRVIDKLLKALLDDGNENVRMRAADVLGSIGKGHDQVIDKLLKAMLEDESSYVRRDAADALGSIGKADDQIIDKLLKAMLEDADSDVRWSAADALGNIGKADDLVIDKLLKAMLGDESSYVRMDAASALGRIGKGDDQVIDKLIPLLDDEDKNVRGIAASVLGSIGKADGRVLDIIRGICEDYREHGDHISDPERGRGLIQLYNLAFRTLWLYG